MADTPAFDPGTINPNPVPYKNFDASQANGFAAGVAALGSAGASTTTGGVTTGIKIPFFDGHITLDSVKNFGAGLTGKISASTSDAFLSLKQSLGIGTATVSTDLSNGTTTPHLNLNVPSVIDFLHRQSGTSAPSPDATFEHSLFGDAQALIENGLHNAHSNASAFFQGLTEGVSNFRSDTLTLYHDKIQEIKNGFGATGNEEGN